MEDYTRQQYPYCAAPWMPAGVSAERCEDGEYCVDGEADSVADGAGSRRLFQRGQAGPFTGEATQGFGHTTISSGDMEQPTENSDADDAVEYSLTRGDAEPLGRHASDNGGGQLRLRGCMFPRGASLRTTDCPARRRTRTRLGMWPGTVGEPVPGALKGFQGICFR